MKLLLVVVFLIIALMVTPMIFTIHRNHDDSVKQLASDHRDIVMLINFHAKNATDQREVLNQKLDILLNIATNNNCDVRRSLED